jgi:protein-L-isoaspartate(D-aspartate) O-methyltransferase
MREVPRERFVAEEMSARAFDDGALSILSGQTISQPYMVARMTEALDLPAWSERAGGLSGMHAGEPPGAERSAADLPRVLDVGTGSGYQAAVLVAVGAEVVSIERDSQLAREAALRLAALGYQVEVVLPTRASSWPPRHRSRPSRSPTSWRSAAG